MKAKELIDNYLSSSLVESWESVESAFYEFEALLEKKPFENLIPQIKTARHALIQQDKRVFKSSLVSMKRKVMSAKQSYPPYYQEHISQLDRLLALCKQSG